MACVLSDLSGRVVPRQQKRKLSSALAPKLNDALSFFIANKKAGRCLMSSVLSH